MKVVRSGHCELMYATYFLTDKVLSLSFNSCINPKPLIIMEKQRGSDFSFVVVAFISFCHGLIVSCSLIYHLK